MKTRTKTYVLRSSIPTTRLDTALRQYEKKHHPIMIGKSCDLSFSCYQKGDENPPAQLQLHTSTEYSLLRGLLYGAAATALVGSVVCVKRAVTRMIQQRRMKHRYEEKYRRRAAKWNREKAVLQGKIKQHTEAKSTPHAEEA